MPRCLPCAPRTCPDPSNPGRPCLRPCPRRPALGLLVLGLCLLLSGGSGCVRTGQKEAQKHWTSFTPQSFQAPLQWFDGKEKLPGRITFAKPFQLRVNATGLGQLVMRDQSLTLIRDTWHGAVELRAAHSLDEKALLRVLSSLLEWTDENYDVESAAGPSIEGRRTLQLTLRPKAAPELAAIATVTDQVERYWLDAEQSFPLRYALLGPDGTELYGWEMGEVTTNLNPPGSVFYHFPAGDNYSIPLYLPTPSISSNQNIPVPALSLAEAQAKLGFPLFVLGAPLRLRSVSLYSGRPVLDYTDTEQGGFTYLLQAPLADPALAEIELKAEGDTWKAPRRQRLVEGRDFGPNNLGLHSLRIGTREIGYDNYFGIKAFGWTENGQAMTLLTTGDFRLALVAIASGQFG